MKIRLTHDAGHWAAGQTVDAPDRRAHGLIQAGYAVAVDAHAVERAMEESTTDPGRGRPAKRKPEVRG